MKNPLHSNLVLFKSVLVDYSLRSRRTLHSNLVLFKCQSLFSSHILFYLYIPIWFYSNDQQRLAAAEAIFFTFQSGSIQMGRLQFIRRYNCYFTFQSGSIQINIGEFYYKYYKDFTFQSGSIQMIIYNFFKSFLLFFTFQSGSIQIQRPT